MRSEMGVTGTGMTNVTQCDLRRTIMLNDQTRTYMITPLDASGDAGAAAPGVPAAAPPQTEKRRGGVVNVVNTINDTGERKEMFGFTARRIKTSMVMEASPDACNSGSSRIETDGGTSILSTTSTAPARSRSRTGRASPCAPTARTKSARAP